MIYFTYLDAGLDLSLLLATVSGKIVMNKSKTDKEYQVKKIYKVFMFINDTFVQRFIQHS